MFIVPITPMSPMQGLGQTGQTEITQGAGGVPFSDLLSEASKQLQETQAASGKDAYELAMGQSDDLHNVMIRSAQAATSIKLTVQLATRAVAAYREILQMQV